MTARVGHFRCFHEKDLPGLTCINRKLCKSFLKLTILEKPFWYILGSVRFFGKLGERDFLRSDSDKNFGRATGRTVSETILKAKFVY